MTKHERVFYAIAENLSEAEKSITKDALDVYSSKSALISVMASLVPVNLSTGPIIKISGTDIVAPETPEGWTGTILVTGIKLGEAEIIAYDSPEFDEIKKEVLALLKDTHPEGSFG